MCWTQAGYTWTCGRPGNRTRARKPPACGGGCRRCPASTAIAPPTTWSTGSRRRGWRGRWWTRTTPQPSAWTAIRCAPWSRPLTPTRGPQALRTAAVIRLLVHNALRVDEACAADVTDLGADAGHRVLRVLRKGARKARIPLTPATAAALDAYLAERARRAGLGDARQLAGPLLATARGGRLRQGHLWELVRRLARDAGIEAWDRLSPHDTVQND